MKESTLGIRVPTTEYDAYANFPIYIRHIITKRMKAYFSKVVVAIKPVLKKQQAL